MQKQIDFPIRRLTRSETRAKSVSKAQLTDARSEKEGRKATSRRRLFRDHSAHSETGESNSVTFENFCLGESPAKKSKIKHKSTPRRAKKFSEKIDLYQLAKHLLSPSAVSTIVGRQEECVQIQSFIEQHLKSGLSTSIYLSGAPGTGKTACINYVISQLKVKHSFTALRVNGMNFRTPQSLYSFIAKELEFTVKTKQNVVEVIEKQLKRSKKQLVLMLDEIDNLNNKHQDVLYTVFDWPRIAANNLIVIGIANTLDFTSRTLSRFHTLKLELVKEIHFNPYSKQQIVEIIQNRLKTFEHPIIKPLALEMVARKVSSLSGDARKALTLCQRAIELVEHEEILKIDPLRATNDDRQNEGSPKNLPLKEASICAVDINHIVKVLNEVYGDGISKDCCNNINNLPLQQQIILCVCLMFSHYRKQKEIEISKAYELFAKICSRKRISYEVSNSSDFQSMCHLLESKAILAIRPSRESARISVCVDETQMKAVLSSKPLFAMILNDTSLM
ncbi:cell division control protein 6-like protein [Dinothrombium tinctorium]|uniref:Cell division control protein n=1 Tax=Dinothrombium tinctorium TaxID=1965070 RepID=A0A443QMA2_9ACAR|nr:cell division control protein 6-like protein [Dinothrombium tinctorium]